MGKALYRSYRSRSFDEVLGQEHITQTLENSIKSETHAHAYLFTGPRGVGKTSVARILAYSVNDESYPPASPQVDIIEIDAASNRRIDEIRDLRERISIAPMSLKYKVYIVDEVHMLTREAFNALLKTLEEPPDHAIFILATTDVNKVPDTIVSRCLRFHFKPVSSEVISKHLKMIAKQEKIDIDTDSLLLISKDSDGSVRDAIALLDQMRGVGSKIRSEEVMRVLGLGSESLVDSIVTAVKDGDVSELINQLRQAEQEGVRTQALAGQISSRIKISLIDNSPLVSASESVALLESLNMASKQDDKVLLELCLLKASVGKVAYDEQRVLVVPVQSNSEAQDSTLDLPKEHKSERDSKSEPPKNLQHQLLEDADSLPGNDELWERILTTLKESNRSLYSIARMAQIETTQKDMTLTFSFPFHYKQAMLAKNLQSIKQAVTQVAPQIINVEIKLKDSRPATENQEQDLTNITNIFGSGEVLES